MGYLAGRGIADITGEIAECGMLGYGMKHQQAQGLHLRLRARAFAFCDGIPRGSGGTVPPGRPRGSGGTAPLGQKRLLLVVCDLPLIFGDLVAAVLARLPRGYGEANVMITGTHTHCGPAGYTGHALYNTVSGGFRPKTFQAIADGIVAAATRAHADLAPAELLLGHGELKDASVNRSRRAFARNPAQDRAFFPDAIDPQVTVLRIVRAGRTVGAITWFATHNTSMTNQNRLVSGDNKGYAAYHWERLVEGVDYLDGEPGFVAAFPQTNAGDMSPNLGLAPGLGPGRDQFENTRIIGLRQYEAAQAAGAVRFDGPLDFRHTHVNLGDITVRPEFTGDGRAHRTSHPHPGAASWAGALVDGPAFKGFRPGRNPLFDMVSKYVIYPLSPRLRDAQAPKGLTLPTRLLQRVRTLVAERGPVQLLRIGPLYLVGIPGEVTIVAGLRLRRIVAGITGASLENVLVAGYSNGYLHYTTTPEEYTAQEYEGGSTLFGRWQLPALGQTVAGLATAMRDGTPVPRGVAEPPPAPRLAKPFITNDRALAGRDFGDVLDFERAGGRVTVRFVAAHPGNSLSLRRTYLEVERFCDGAWTRVADDGDWSTRLYWARSAPGARGATSVATVTWDIPDGAAPGRYRIRYHGNTPTTPFTGTTAPFTIP